MILHLTMKTKAPRPAPTWSRGVSLYEKDGSSDNANCISLRPESR
jgi:hypothetical protein